MCLCWDFDKNGTVTGICSMEELARRIHDPNFRPEIKAAKREAYDRHERKRSEHLASLSDERKEEIRKEWLRALKGNH